MSDIHHQRAPRMLWWMNFRQGVVVVETVLSKLFQGFHKKKSNCESFQMTFIFYIDCKQTTSALCKCIPWKKKQWLRFHTFSRLYTRWTLPLFGSAKGPGFHGFSRSVSGSESDGWDAKTPPRWPAILPGAISKLQVLRQGDHQWWFVFFPSPCALCHVSVMEKTTSW